ncbi:MAG: LytTR family DNA-binding domain-containing protein [Lachnospiraceae bacterium]
MCRVAICDDNVETMDYLDKLVKNFFKHECSVVKCNSAFEVESYVYGSVRGEIDILLLDIDLDGISGIDVAKRINELYPSICIVFITGNIEYAKNILEAEPTYFLVKPIDTALFEKAMTKCIKVMQEMLGKDFVFSYKGGITKICVDDILYVESNKRRIILHEVGGVHHIYMKLSEVEDRLPSSFLRCHQSFLVNMNFIQKLVNSSFRLSNELEIPISQTKYREAKQRYLDYLGG